MHISIRIARILVLLCIVIGIPIAAASVAGHYVGHRVYLLNSTRCQVTVMSEHEGATVQPGEIMLVKPGLIDRTPSLIIIANWDMWFDGLHFTSDRLQTRFKDDIVVSNAWFADSIFGTTLTYELTRQGRLVIMPPKGMGQNALTQPAGLPLEHRLGTRSKECVSG